MADDGAGSPGDGRSRPRCRRSLGSSTRRRGGAGPPTIAVWGAFLLPLVTGALSQLFASVALAGAGDAGLHSDADPSGGRRPVWGFLSSPPRLPWSLAKAPGAGGGRQRPGFVRDARPGAGCAPSRLRRGKIHPFRLSGSSPCVTFRPAATRMAPSFLRHPPRRGWRPTAASTCRNPIRRSAAPNSTPGAGFTPIWLFCHSSKFIDDIPAADLQALVAKTTTPRSLPYPQRRQVAGNHAAHPARRRPVPRKLSNGPTLAFKDMGHAVAGQSL